jgi:Tol biopolymer transport system component
MTWRDNRDGNWEIYFARLDAEGNKLGREKRITENTSYSSEASMVWTGDGFGLAWNDIPDADWEIYFVLLDRYGNAVTPETRVTNVASPSWYPSLAWSDDGFGLAWRDERDGNSEIYFTTLDAAGTPSGVQTRLTNASGTSYRPRVVWTGEEYEVAWYDGRYGAVEIFLTRVSSNGTEIGSDVRVRSDHPNSRNPDLVWTGAESAVVFEYWAGSNWEILHQRIRCCDDVDEDGWNECQGDANDEDSLVSPGEEEVCDGRDTNSNGQVDEICDGLCDEPQAGTAVRLTTLPDRSKVPDLFWSGWNAHVVAWEDARHGEDEIYMKAVYPDGSVLFDERRVSDADGTSSGAQIVWTGTHLAVAWQNDAGGDWDIWFRLFDGGGNPTGPAIPVTDHPGHSMDLGGLVWTGSEYGLVWRDNRDGDWEIFFARLDASGHKIGQEVQVSDNETYSSEPAVVWTGKKYGVAWIDMPESDWEIYFAVLDEFGAPAGTARRVTTVAAASMDPALAPMPSGYGLAWEDERHGNAEIYFARLDTSGTVTGGPTRVTDDPAASKEPSVVWTGSEFVVAWDDYRDGNAEIYVARLDSDALEVGDDVRVTDHAWDSVLPSLAWTGVGLGVAWSDYRDGNWEVYYSEISCCDDVDLDGYNECNECDDGNPDVHPGADELCNGIDDDCDLDGAVPPDESDDDGDGWVECGPWVGDDPGVVGGYDCADDAATMYPGSPEVNNGLDDNCPGEPGSGMVDEITGWIGFWNAVLPYRLEWPEQLGAGLYEVARSTWPDFSGAGECTTFLTPDAWYDTAEIPVSGQCYHYLVRSWTPFTGSWGADGDGIERTTICP